MKNEFQAPYVVNLAIQDKATLYAAYMPWLKQGGLFFSSREQHRMHEDVTLALDLLGGEEKLTVSGKVVWITPRGSSNKRSAGIGVMFSDDGAAEAQKKIEALIAGMDTSRPTHTM